MVSAGTNFFDHNDLVTVVVRAPIWATLPPLISYGIATLLGGLFGNMTAQDLTSVLGIGVFVALITYFFALLAMILIGLPIYFVLQRVRRLTRTSFLAAGAISGGVIAATMGAMKASAMIVLYPTMSLFAVALTFWDQATNSSVSLSDFEIWSVQISGILWFGLAGFLVASRAWKLMSTNVD